MKIPKLTLALIKRRAAEAWKDTTNKKYHEGSRIWLQGYAAALDWVACLWPKKERKKSKEKTCSQSVSPLSYVRQLARRVD